MAPSGRVQCQGEGSTPPAPSYNDEEDGCTNAGVESLVKEGSLVDDIDSTIQPFDSIVNFDDDVWNSQRRFAAVSAFYNSEATHSQGVGEPKTCDFIHLVSEISRIYRRGTYLKMIYLIEGKDWKPLGEGSSSTVHSSIFTVQAQTPWTSSSDRHVLKDIPNRVAIKRVALLNGAMSAADMKQCISELRILDHLHDNPFVVNLRGVGWFNGFHNDKPNPQPAIILEEAFNTLGYLIGQEADFETLFGIYAQVASGLSALHEIGVAHGDVKPANVLLFKKPEVREGVESYTYIAKLSDFGSSVFDTGYHQPLPAGTKGYSAPEVVHEDQRAGTFSFEAILQTDVWSLGILFSVLWSSEINAMLLSTLSLGPTGRKEWLGTRISIRLGNSSAEPELLRVGKAVFDNTLKVNPALRRLDIVRDNLLPYLPGESNSSPRKLDRLVLPSDDFVAVSYEGTKHLSGNIKDSITDGLRTITLAQDPRRGQALWELGVIYLSRFVDPRASVEEGLSYIRQAAEIGDHRARALYGRLCKAFATTNKVTSEDQLVAWLEDAAKSGHRTASEELASFGRKYHHLVMECQAVSASLRFHALPDGPLKSWDKSAVVSTRQDTVLHRAAATGRVDHLERLLTESNSDIEACNLDGDTPLISACQAGQLETALFLLGRDANAAARNKLGENSLHFCWCFFGHASEVIVDALVGGSADLSAIALGRPLTADLDTLPLLPGTPVERAAGRHRVDLVHILLQHKDVIRPSNGPLARRMLVWALRLHDLPLQKLLIERGDLDATSFNAQLLPLIETTWRYRRLDRNLIDAACAGWVSGTQHGWDVPLDFWLACCNGTDYAEVLRQTLDNIVTWLNSYQSVADTEAMVDRSIRWANGESLYKPLFMLLRLKMERTSGQQSHRKDFEEITWDFYGNNPGPMLPQRVHLIDRIFVYPVGGTLLQQSLRAGDRLMFHLLLQWRANPHLPCQIDSTESVEDKDGKEIYEYSTEGLHCHRLRPLNGKKVNVYSMLAYVEHRDFWFANELKSLGVPLSSPWRVTPFMTRRVIEPRHIDVFFGADLCDGAIDMPPLLHALGLHFWEYTLWLLDSGASLNQCVNSQHTIVDIIAAMSCSKCFRFFFGDSGTDACRTGAHFLPQQYKELSHSLLLRIFFAMYSSQAIYYGSPMSTRRILITHPSNRWGSHVESLRCLEYLLNQYPLPDADLSAPYRLFSSHRHPSRRWLMHAAACVGREDGSGLKLVLKIWRTRGEAVPKQPLLEYIQRSPADDLSTETLRDILAQSDHAADLSHLAPSLLGWQLFSCLGFFSFNAILFMIDRVIGGSIACWCGDLGVWRFAHFIPNIMLMFMVIAFPNYLYSSEEVVSGQLRSIRHIYCLLANTGHDWSRRELVLRHVCLAINLLVVSTILAAVGLQFILLLIAISGPFNSTVNPFNFHAKAGSWFELCPVDPTWDSLPYENRGGVLFGEE